MGGAEAKDCSRGGGAGFRAPGAGQRQAAASAERSLSRPRASVSQNQVPEGTGESDSRGVRAIPHLRTRDIFQEHPLCS